MTIRMNEIGQVLKVSAGELMKECCCDIQVPPSTPPGSIYLDANALFACCDSSAHAGRDPYDSTNDWSGIGSYKEVIGFTPIITLFPSFGVYKNNSFSVFAQGYLASSCSGGASYSKTFNLEVSVYLSFVSDPTYGNVYKPTKVEFEYSVSSGNAIVSSGRYGFYASGSYEWGEEIWPYANLSCGGRNAGANFYMMFNNNRSGAGTEGFVKVFQS